MKIAIDAREMIGQIAGKGRYVAEVVKHLAEIDSENTYYIYTKEVLTKKLPKNFTNLVIGGKPGLRQLWLANDIKARGCDLLFAPTGYLPVVFSKVPTVVTVHDLAIFVTKDAKPALKTLIAEKLLLGQAVRKSDQIIAVSQSTKADLHQLFGTAENKITVTPLGYDKTAYQPNSVNDDKVLQQHNLKPNYLLFIGTLEPRKNIEGIVRAYSQLTPALQDEYPLVIGGKKGWYYDSIFTTVNELGLSGKIKFLGRVPDEHLPALYRQAKVFIFPSFYEGFGLPPLESLASGTPVITANNSSLPEVVGEAGILVDPRKVAQLKQAIERMLTDEKLYQELKKQALEQAKLFSWEKTARATLAVFKKVVNEQA